MKDGIDDGEGDADHDNEDVRNENGATKDEDVMKEEDAGRKDDVREDGELSKDEEEGETKRMREMERVGRMRMEYSSMGYWNLTMLI